MKMSHPKILLNSDNSNQRAKDDHKKSHDFTIFNIDDFHTLIR